jgi:hypothetical protein
MKGSRVQTRSSVRNQLEERSPSPSDIIQNRSRLEERTPSPVNLGPRRLRLEIRALTPPPPKQPKTINRVEERLLTPSPTREVQQLEERSPSPPLLELSSPPLPVNKYVEERSPSPFSLPYSYNRSKTDDGSTSLTDELNEDIYIEHLNDRSLLDNNIVIKEYILSGNKSTKILIDHMASFLKVIEKLVKSLTSLNPNDRIQINIKPKSWDHHISTPIVRVKHFRPSLLLAAIQAAAQSGLSVDLADDVRLDIRYLKIAGSYAKNAGRNKYKRISSKMAIKDRRCIIEITNKDNMCLARALAVGIAKYNLDTCNSSELENNKKIYEAVKRKDDDRHHHQAKEAVSYCLNANVDPKSLCGPKEIEMFENSLGVIIKIIAADRFNEVVYDTMNKTETLSEVLNKPIVYLYRTQNLENSIYHYDVIVNITAFFHSSNFCNYCNEAYNHNRHQCKDITDWCYSCFRRNCTYTDSIENEIKTKCIQCNVTYRNKCCQGIHESENTCKTKYYCFICKQILVRKKIIEGSSFRLQNNNEIIKEHWCGRKCRLCHKEVDPLHKCFLQKFPFKPKSCKYLFLDFETSQVNREHIPIFCYLIWSVEENEVIKWEERAIGLGEDITDEVGTFLFTKQFKDYTIIAHNMKGYDGCFLLRYLAQNGYKPHLILRDKKILALLINSLQIRIIDSLNFLPMALSQFSKAFNLKTVKGYFPHFFSSPEVFDYVGEMPKEEMYGTGSMKPSQYKEFKKWYDDRKLNENKFHFRDEISFYCKQDVVLLQQGCWVFRELMLELTENECDAFQYFTLPGLCNAVYKKKFMPPNSIAAVPPNGYIDTQAFSSKSLEWLSFLELTVPNIKHIGNCITGEVELANMRVDGFDLKTKTVYEFYGCYYHACLKCYPNRYNLHPLFKQTYLHVYALTREREQRLRKLGYSIIKIWECEWNKMVEEDDEIRKFLKENPHRLQPLDPFKAFFGGRVESFKLLIKNDGSEIKYEDVNSLYPFINATKEYPIGHPLIICNDFGSLETVTERYFGFIYCKVRTPRHLHIPVLPGKYGGDSKLIFTLCRSCASEIPRRTEFCKHSDEERSLVGTWFTEELKVAENMGYEITKVYGIYHFTEKSDELFSNYIRTFYKIKLLASGKPKVENLDEYIDEVFDRDCINLHGEQFTDNPSLRSVSKLMLNSLWGKFGTRRILPEATFCTEIADVRKLFENELIEVSNVIEVHENMVIAITKKRSNEFLEINNNANIFVAACTTAYARIELYSYLAKLKDRAVYTDTDCCFYISRPLNDLPTGEFLGQLKNELDVDDFIIWFVSGGPKNYAYITKKGKCVFKIKGISLTVTNLETFTFENMARIVSYFATVNDGENFVCLKSRELFHKKIHEKRSELLNEHLKNPSVPSGITIPGIISTFNPSKIKIQNDWKISSITEQKLYSCLYDKRMVLKDFSTLPFGYCET